MGPFLALILIHISLFSLLEHIHSFMHSTPRVYLVSGTMQVLILETQIHNCLSLTLLFVFINFMELS